MNNKISVVVLARNASKILPRCLNSLKWAGEVVVIDDYSSDNTSAIARQWGSKVLNHSLDGNFSNQRNWALQQTKHQWVMFVDADETVPKCLADEIVRRVGNERGVAGYHVHRHDIFFGKILKHGENGHNVFLRLALKKNNFWRGKVHEKWIVKGEVKSLKCPLNHFLPNDLSIFLSKINRYSSLRAKELYLKQSKSDWLAIAAYPLGKFLKDYFYWQGFRDGLRGFLISILMALHSFLVRAKLWHYRHDR